MTVENIDIVKELVKKELDAITKMLNEYPLPLSLAMLLNRYAILYMSKLMGPERPRARPDLLKNFIEAIRGGYTEDIQITFMKLLWNYNNLEKDPLELREIWPSWLPFCPLKYVYFILDHGRMQRTDKMVKGALLHTALEAIFGPIYKPEEARIRLDNGWEIVGRPDLIIDDVIIEFKYTTRPNNAEYAKDQLMFYLGALEYEKGYVFAIHPDRFYVVVHEVTYDDFSFHYLLNKALSVSDAVDMVLEGQKIPIARLRGQMPEYEWECLRCPYHRECLLKK